MESPIALVDVVLTGLRISASDIVAADLVGVHLQRTNTIMNQLVEDKYSRGYNGFIRKDGRTR